MTEVSWPHIGPAELRALWEEHAPSFLRLDDVESLPNIRESFLTWLSEKGFELGSVLPTRSIIRARLERVTLTRRGEAAETEVVISLASKAIEAKRIGPALPDEILRMSAEATLDAVNQLFPPLNFDVESAYRINPEYDPIAVVVARNHTTNITERIVGACSITASTTEAGAKAALDAVNRRVELAFT
jgi:hypothetical protein